MSHVHCQVEVMMVLCADEGTVVADVAVKVGFHALAARSIVLGACLCVGNRRA